MGGSAAAGGCEGYLLGRGGIIVGGRLGCVACGIRVHRGTPAANLVADAVAKLPCSRGFFRFDRSYLEHETHRVAESANRYDDDPKLHRLQEIGGSARTGEMAVSAFILALYIRCQLGQHIRGRDRR